MARFVCVFDEVPHCTHGGGGITAYAVARSLKTRGHDVTVLSLKASQVGSVSQSVHEDHLKSLGIHVDYVENCAPRTRRGIRGVLFPQMKDLFASYQNREGIEKKVKELRPDGVVMYHWDAVAALHGYRDVRKLALVGDPKHLPFLFRREFRKRNGQKSPIIAKLREAVDSWISIPRYESIMADLLSECTECGAFAAHHARELRDMGAQRCAYFRTPIPEVDSSSTSTRAQTDAEKVFKILHIGHLQGIATLSGVELMAKEIMPILKHNLPPLSFQIHLVGGYFETIPESLRRLLSSPSVIVRGQVTPADEEFLTSDVILVPTPIELGIRVRILTALSFGACVVAHNANKKGIPELQDGENCLLGGSGAELASACERIFHDEKLRARLQKGARKTFEEFFSTDSAGNEICRVAEAML